ncbi:MAG: CDP-glucose 4,6-dehydratase, partial [Deltaproteobacteria bacterium]|nr:CDP-glucose 4,6-dehydratase [Deltaproteobacteria bacterium]
LIASTRAGNVIGGGDWAEDRLIPDIMKAFIANLPIKIRYPNAIRPWQYVLEPLEGYLKLAEKLWIDGSELVGAWNFGANEGEAKPVWWVADYLIQKWGKKAKWISDSAENMHEATYLKLDCSKARALLDWRPKLNIEETLNVTVNWYKAYAKGKDMRAITLEEIAWYEKNI